MVSRGEERGTGVISDARSATGESRYFFQKVHAVDKERHAADCVFRWPRRTDVFVDEYLEYMGDSVYPSGSLEPVGVMIDSWMRPMIYRPVLIPVGSLVEVRPNGGAVWCGSVAVVIERLGEVGNRMVLCRIAGVKGIAEFPEYTLKLLSLPPRDE